MEKRFQKTLSRKWPQWDFEGKNEEGGEGTAFSGSWFFGGIWRLRKQGWGERQQEKVW